MRGPATTSKWQPEHYKCLIIHWPWTCKGLDDCLKFWVSVFNRCHLKNHKNAVLCFVYCQCIRKSSMWWLNCTKFCLLLSVLALASSNILRSSRTDCCVGYFLVKSWNVTDSQAGLTHTLVQHVGSRYQRTQSVPRVQAQCSLVTSSPGEFQLGVGRAEAYLLTTEQFTLGGRKVVSHLKWGCGYAGGDGTFSLIPLNDTSLTSS